MSESNSTVKTAVIVAIIGLVGTVITVLVNNWDKFSETPDPIKQESAITNNEKKELPASDTNEPKSSTSEIKSSVDYLSLSETITNNFLTALKTKDVNSLVEMCSTPFYNDHNILTSANEVRERFERDLSQRSSTEFPLIKSIKVKTVAEWKKEGLVKENDRILSNLNIPDDSYFGVAEFEKDALVLVFRKVGDNLKVAGIWD